MNNSTRLFRLALLPIAFFLLACRLGDFITEFRSTPTIDLASLPTLTPTATETPTITLTPTESLTPEPSDTPFPTPTLPPTTTPTQSRTPTRPLPPTITRTPSQTPTQPTATPDFYYKISYSYCGPDFYQTYIEGTVYENGTAKNGVLVRISQGPDGLPDPNPDYKTGTDPRRVGYYFQNIDANRPHGGLWYLWVLDPNTGQRLSVIAIVKTDPQYVEDNTTSPGSCQYATVNFSNNPATIGQTTPVASGTPLVTPSFTPTCTPTSTATSTPTPTSTYTLTPSSTPTGTLTPTNTPTASPTFTATPTRGC